MAREFNPFARGRRFEYRTREFLRKSGWFVVRQPRSAFPDLIALRNGQILLVECKMGGRISRNERRNIVKIRKAVNGTALMAFRKGNGIGMNSLSRSWKFDKPFQLPQFQEGIERSQ